MYKNDSDASDLSAFRAAEKKYQRTIEQLIKFKRGKPRGTRRIEHPPNLDGVIDVHPPEDIPNKAATAAYTHIPLTSLLNPQLASALPPSAQAYIFPAHPGFVLFRGTLSPALQRRLVQDCLVQFPSSPAHTNFNRTHGSALDGLWHASHAGLKLEIPILENNNGAEHRQKNNNWMVDGDGAPATQLLRKLRWASIGPVFDWTRREYLIHDPYLPLPEYLADYATSLANIAADISIIKQDLITDTTNGASRKQSDYKKQGDSGELSSLYRPDAALINYYHPGDTLCGHIDDAENDLSQPLVSISLGCPAVFLLGGESKDVAPTALLLQGGDVVVLGGKARRCYHGVPRILPREIVVREGYEVKDEEEGEFAPFAEYMSSCRINISVRATLH